MRNILSQAAARSKIAGAQLLKFTFVNDELNPYASPNHPEESEPFDLQRDIILQYAHDFTLQSNAAISSPGNTVIRTFTVLGLIAGGFFGGAWLGNFAYLIPIHSDAGAEVIRGVIIVVCMLGAAALQILLINRLLAAREIRRLRQHPIIGVLGDWQLTVDQENLTVANSGGRQSWPLATARYEVNDFNTPILWLEPNLPIALPYAAGDQELYSRQADAVLRDRVGRRVME